MGSAHPDAETERRLLMAEGFFELGDHREALRLLDLLPETGRKHPQAALLRALLLMSLEMWPEAEAVAISALSAPAGSSVLWYSLAVAQAQQHKLHEARESLKSAFKLDITLQAVARQDIALAGLW